MRFPSLAGALMIGAAIGVSACGSSSTNSSTHTSTTHSEAARAGFQAGPDPCQLITSQVIYATLKQRMTQASRSKSSCSFINGGKTLHFSISTAKTTRPGAEAAVNSAASTVKGRVVHVSRVGDRAIAYLVTTKKLSIATALVAKNGNLVFLDVGSPSADHLMPGVIALAKAAVGNT